jgi:hypothetical protein
MRSRDFLIMLACVALVGVLLLIMLDRSYPHDIYTSVHGKNGQLCCGGTDCAATFWRERKGHYEFLTRERTWIEIPGDRITFLPIPGEPEDAPPNFAHLCYRAATESDRLGPASANVFGDIFLYCAFIKPGAT